MIALTTALAGSWFAGAAFGLDPLGDEVPVLSLTLLSTLGRDFVYGLVVPSLPFWSVMVLTHNLKHANNNK